MDFPALQQLLAEQGHTLPLSVMISMLQRLQKLQQQRLPQRQLHKQQQQQQDEQPPQLQDPASAAVVAMQQELCRYLSCDLQLLQPSGLIIIAEICAELGGNYPRLSSHCIRVLGRKLEQSTDLRDLSSTIQMLSGICDSTVLQGCQGPVLQQLERGMFFKLAAKATAEQLAGLIWGVARLGWELPAPRVAYVVKRFRKQLAEAKPWDVGCLIWGLGTMGGNVVSEDVLLQMIRRASGGAPSAYSISCILWGMAAMGHKLPAFELQQLLRHLFQRIDKVEPQHLYGVVWGLAKAEQQLEAEDVQKLVKSLLSKRDRANPIIISNVIWGIAKMGHSLPGHQLWQLLQALLSKLPHASQQCIVMTLWAAAKMQVQVPRQQLQQLLAGLVVKLPGADPVAVCNVLWALASMDLRVAEKHLQPITNAFTLADAEPGIVAGVFWNLGSMPVQPFLPPSLLTPSARNIILSKLPGMQSRDLARLAWACGRFGYRDDALLVPLYHRAVELLQQDDEASDAEGASDISSSSSKGASNSSSSSSRKGASDSSSSSSSFKAVAVAHLCWAAAVLDMQPLAKQVQQLSGRYRKRWEGHLEDYKRQLYQVHVWLLDNGLGGCLPYRLSEEYREAWGAELAAAEDASKLQQAVFEAALQLPMKFRKRPQLEVQTRDGFLSIDIFFVTPEKVPVAIEVDGPRHFRRPDLQPTGSTLWRNRALAARGYVVVSVPYWEWGKVARGGMQAQVVYLDKKVEQGVAEAKEAKAKEKLLRQAVARESRGLRSTRRTAAAAAADMKLRVKEAPRVGAAAGKVGGKQKVKAAASSKLARRGARAAGAKPTKAAAAAAAARASVADNKLLAQAAEKLADIRAKNTGAGAAKAAAKQVVKSATAGIAGAAGKESDEKKDKRKAATMKQQRPIKSASAAAAAAAAAATAARVPASGAKGAVSGGKKALKKLGKTVSKVVKMKKEAAEAPRSAKK